MKTLNTRIGNLTYFDEIDKGFMITDTMQPGVIDERMRELVNEINSIPTLMTMNCCQGGSEPFTSLEVKERGYNGTHCPITYVDFYAIDHDYVTANLLIAFVVAEIGNDERVNGRMTYEEDGYVEDNEFFRNGDIMLRFRIEGESPDVIDEITSAVRKFKEQAGYSEG